MSNDQASRMKIGLILPIAEATTRVQLGTLVRRVPFRIPPLARPRARHRPTKCSPARAAHAEMGVAHPICSLEPTTPEAVAWLAEALKIVRGTDLPRS